MAAEHPLDILARAYARAQARAKEQEQADQSKQSQPQKSQSEQSQSEPQIEIMGEVITLPVCKGGERISPSSVLRSALFGVIGRGQRQYLKAETLASWPGVTIRYTGLRLDQADLDVWLALLHHAREHNLGEQVPVSIYGILKAMGRATGKTNHEWFKDSVRRLTACVVEITINQRTYGGPLVQGFDRDEMTGNHVLYLNPKLRTLFEDNDFTRLDWEMRLGLKSEFARWLHGYIASHRATRENPHRINMERLRELCGSSSSHLRRFRQAVREAMDELQAAGVVASWRITPGDALEVVRPLRRQQLLDGKKL